MTPDQNNSAPVVDNMVVDGGTPTEQEQVLMDQGLEDKPEGDGAPAPVQTDEEKAAAPAAADPAAIAEAERVAAEQQAEQDRVASERQATNASAAAEARANADAIARATAVEKPAPPVDFDAEFKKLRELKLDGDLEDDDYDTKFRDLSRQESLHTVELGNWEADQRRLGEEAKGAALRSENAWNTAALAWEAANAEFMADRLNAAEMQDAIAKIGALNLKEGRFMAPQEVLEEAAQHAFRKANWAPATPAAVKDPKREIANAVSARKQDKPPQTLGDVPNAGNEPITGNEAFGNLDRLGIEDLEESVQHMTPAQQEKYLRDAPGASANGRGDDPKDE